MKKNRFLLPSRIWQCKTTKHTMKLQKSYSLQQIYLSTIDMRVNLVCYDLTGNSKICKHNLGDETTKIKGRL